MPPEVAAEDECEALRVADWNDDQERDKGHQEDDAREACGDDTSEEEVEDALAFPTGCPGS